MTLRGWAAGRTLRTRLIAGVIVLLTLSCVGIGFATSITLEGFLINRLDQQLAEAGSRLDVSREHLETPNSSEEPSDSAKDPGVRGQAVGTLAAQASRGSITEAVVVQDKAGLVSLSTVPLTPVDRSKLLSLTPDGPPSSAHLAALGDYRLRATSGPDDDIRITGLPLQDIDSTVHRLQATELIVFAAALLLTGLAGAGWVTLSLRPLHRVTMTAKQVSSLSLGSGAVDLPNRVPETDPRTEVGQLGEAFNQMLGHVETSLAERETSEARLRRFVADASHELRTPLAGIRSYAELARRSTEAVPEEVSHALGRVESESVRMGLLVDDLLLLARLDTGRPLEQEDVDLSRLVIEVSSDARVAGPDHKWSLDLPDEPLVVRGDEHRLHQVVANLLSNARIHTPAGTSVVVRLRADQADPGSQPGQQGPSGQGGQSGQRGPSGHGEQSGHGGQASHTGRPGGRRVLLSVRDNGPGIPAELQSHVFERFVRADDSRSRVKGSTGLGLAIAHAVVKAHGGSLTLISDETGTEFLISLPAGNGT